MVVIKKEHYPNETVVEEHSEQRSSNCPILLYRIEDRLLDNTLSFRACVVIEPDFQPLRIGLSKQREQEQ